jgi:17beta-estradiol 17-dehydrogenase / very-long-chain 3-oxoacyl-CoA reductase
VVNNVGMTYERPSYFDEVACNSPTFSTSMINLNVVAVTTMTRLLLPPMLQRGNGGVFINVGSVASLYGLPFFSLYSATKSFMETFTLDLALEYESKGILFQYQSPGYVDTKIAKQGGSSLFIPSPDQYAWAGLRSVGLQQKTFVWLPQRLFAFAGILSATVVGKEFVRRTIYSMVFTLWLFVKKRQMDKDKNKYSIV